MLATGAVLRDALAGSLTAVALTDDQAPAPPWSDAALAAGCDRVVCIDAPAHDDLDYLGTAMVLSAAARTLGCDLLLCDDQGPPPDRCAVGPAVAELLGITHLTGVVAATPDAAPGTVPGASPGAMTATPPGAVIAHQRAGGRVHRFRCPLPAVLCMTALAPDDRPTAIPDSARVPAPEAPDATPDATIDRLSLRDLGLDPRALRHRSRRPARPSPSAAASQAHTAASSADPVARSAVDPVRR